jgi:D-alanyl-lipoteichoic acid acyltransferase DltB (MBOAT superfamily)
MKLLSLEFIVLAVALVFWVRFVRGPLRLIGFLAGSAIYASTFLTPVGRVTIAIFLLAGYALARVAQRWPRLTAPSVALLIAGFVYLRGYDVVVAFLPERFWSVALSIAGLSYLLFKVVHVVVDAAGGRLPHLGLLSYLAYCLNFTTFLLGPIQRYQSFVEQWEGRQEPLEPDMASHFDAVNRVLRGFLKKWVVATVLAKWALLPGESIAGMGFSEVMLGAWLFYVYLYFDYSGYCDVVIGIVRLMGIAPPENFWLPFFSPNIAQYWLRVHRSLTEWLTDYVFHPLYTGLLRSRLLRGHRLASRNVAIGATMLIAGVWHGTTLSFVLFGLVHALYQVVYRTTEHVLTGRLGAEGLLALRARPSWAVAGTVVTFIATASAYVFFVLTPSQLVSLIVATTGVR